MEILSPHLDRIESKNRVSQACVQCSTRKTKCDGATPVCKACETRHRECFYAEPRRRKRQKVEDLNYHLGSPQQHQPTPIPSTLGHLSTEKTRHSLPANVSQIEIRTGITAQPRSTGGSGASQIVPGAVTPVTPPGDDIVNSDIATHLITTYWATVHPVWPILYKPMYDTTNPKLLAELLPRSVLYAIYAIAASTQDQYASSTFTNVRDGRVPAPSVFFDASLVAMQQSGKSDRSDPKSYHFLDVLSSSVEKCQTLTLLALQQHSVGESSNSYTLCSQAATMAINLRLHRALPADTEPTLIQVNSRLWWNLYVLDKIIACELSRPPMLRKDETNADVHSISESDEFQLVKSRGPKVDKLLSTKAYTMSGLTDTVLLAEEMETILDQVYSFAARAELPKHSQKVDNLRMGLWQMLKDHENALRDWHSRWELQSRNQTTPPPVVIRNMVWVWTAVILLNRPFYYSWHHQSFRGRVSSTASSASNMHPLEVCYDAAENLCQIIEDHVEDLSQFPCDLLHPIFTASSVLKYYSDQKPDNLESNIKRRLEMCLRWLSTLGQTYVDSRHVGPKSTQDIQAPTDYEQRAIGREPLTQRTAFRAVNPRPLPFGSSSRDSPEPDQARPFLQHLEPSVVRNEWAFLDNLGDPRDEFSIMENEFRDYLETQHVSARG